MDPFKETIKDRCDIVEIIDAYVPLKRAGTNYKGLCPFHSEKTPSFTVNVTKQMYYCFGCQKGGDVIRFVMEHESVDFVGALKILADKAGIPFPDHANKGFSPSRSTKDNVSVKAKLYEVHEKLADWYQRNLRSKLGLPARQYLQSRGINDDLIMKFRLGYAPHSWHKTLNWGKEKGYTPALLKQAGMITTKEEASPLTNAYDRFRDRLMFPIANEQGGIIAFSGRILENDQKAAKYINSPETPVFHKSKVLYGLALARQAIKQKGFVLMCEGQMDVLACHHTGFHNAVATLGTAFTPLHARLLKRFTEVIVLMYDADKAGINAILKSIQPILEADLVPKVVLLKQGQDPDSFVRQFGSDALAEKINQAEDYFTFRIRLETQRQEISTPDGKAKAIFSVLEDIAKIDSLVKRSEYCRILSEALKVPQNIVFQELNRFLKKSAGGTSKKNKKDENNTQAPQIFAAPNTMTLKAEGILLEIVLNHEILAHQLLNDLPFEYISDTPIGKALSEAMAHTEQGEWSEGEKLLAKNLDRYQSREVNKALFDPDYGPTTEEKLVKKAYLDCLFRGIIMPKVDEQMEKIQFQLKSCDGKAERSQLQKKYIALRKQKSEFFIKRDTLS